MDGVFFSYKRVDIFIYVFFFAFASGVTHIMCLLLLRAFWPLHLA